MQQTVFEIDVPKTILDYGFSKVDVQSHVNEWSVLQLFTEDHISSGKAARLLDITRVEFLDMLYKKRIKAPNKQYFSSVKFIYDNST